MHRRSLLKLRALFAVTLPAFAFQEEKSKYKSQLCDLFGAGRAVLRLLTRLPPDRVRPAGVEVANPCRFTRNRRRPGRMPPPGGPEVDGPGWPRYGEARVIPLKAGEVGTRSRFLLPAA